MKFTYLDIYSLEYEEKDEAKLKEIIHDHVSTSAVCAAFEDSLTEGQREILQQWAFAVFRGSEISGLLGRHGIACDTFPVGTPYSASYVGKPQVTVDIEEWLQLTPMDRDLRILQEGVFLEQVVRGDLEKRGMSGNFFWMGEEYTPEKTNALVKEAVYKLTEEFPTADEEDIGLEGMVAFPWVAEAVARTTAGMSILYPDSVVKPRLNRLCDEWVAMITAELNDNLDERSLLTKPLLSFDTGTAGAAVLDWIVTLFRPTELDLSDVSGDVVNG